MPNPTVNWRLTATDQVSAAVGKIDARIGALSKSFQSLGSIGIGAGIGAAVLTIGRSLQRVTAQALEWGDSIDDLAQRTGIAQSVVQDFSYAAEQTGTSVEAVTKAIAKLARSTYEAQKGSKEIAQAFAEIGLSADDLAGTPLDQRLYVVADALAKVTDQGRYLAIGQKLLGKQFAELAPVLRDGGDSLKRYAEESRRLGGLSSAQIKALGDTNDAFGALGTAIDNVARRAVAAVSPALQRLANMLADNVVAGADSAASALDDAGSAIDRMARVIGGVNVAPVRELVSTVTGVAWDVIRDSVVAVANGFVILAGGIRTAASVAASFTFGNVSDSLDDEKAKIDEYLESVKDLLAGVDRVAKGPATRARIRTPQIEAPDIVGLDVDPSPAITAAIEGWEELARASKAAADEAARDIARIVESNRTPLEEYRAGIARVTELMRSGLSADVAAREIERLGGVLGQQTQAMVDATDAGKAWAQQQQDAADILASIEQPIDRVAKAYRKIDEALSAKTITQDQAVEARKKALEDLIGTADKAAVQVTSKTDEVLRSIQYAVEGYAKEITDIFFDTTKSIGDMFSDLLNQIARMMVQKSIVEPLLGAVTSFIGGAFGSSGIGTIDMSKLPQRRALGGPVTAGESYLVGERGPELFMPKQSGQIIPNGAGGGTLAITFNVNSLDPRAAAAVIAENERTITNVIRRAQIRAGNRPTV